jgi:flagellar hook assembly protein FlgD
VSVSAADNLAAGITAAEHRSTASVDFTVSENPALKVVRAILFPNPIRSGGGGGGGTFVVDVPGDSVNVLLRIYTVGGKLIREIHHMGGLGQVQIRWDGLDAEGDPLANGTYLYHVHVNPRDPDGSSSARQTASADGRIVVVGH